MESIHDLWRNYDAALRSGKVDLAKRLLRQMNTRQVEAPSSINPRKRRGCASCKRRLT